MVYVYEIIHPCLELKAGLPNLDLKLEESAEMLTS